MTNIIIGAILFVLGVWVGMSLMATQCARMLGHLDDNMNKGCNWITAKSEMKKKFNIKSDKF